MMSSRLHPVKVNTGRMKSAMAAKSLGFRQTAEKAEITYATFSKILKDGVCSPTFLGRIARVLGVPVWELVDR